MRREKLDWTDDMCQGIVRVYEPIRECMVFATDNFHTLALTCSYIVLSMRGKSGRGSVVS